MEYRIGKCSDCGAEYKVPASFAHNVARCKVCQGVVHLGQPGGAAPASPPRSAAGPAPSAPAKPAATTPSAPAERPQPMPARKVAPAPAQTAKPAPRPAARPAPAPRPAAKAPEPAAASAAHAGDGPRKGGTLERLKAERKQSAAKTPVVAAAGVGAAVRPSSRRRKDDEEGEGASSSTGRRGRRAPEKKRSMLPALLSVVGIALLGLAAYLLRDKMFPPATAAGPEGTAAEEAPTTPEEGATTAPEGEQQAAATEPEEPAATEPAEDALAAAPPTPAPQVDPATVDLTAIPDFGKVDGTTEEEWQEMNEQMRTWMDVSSGAAGNRARIALIGRKRAAFPVILNFFKRLDFSTEEGKGNGDQCQRALMDICNGTNFGWKYTTEPADVYFNKRVVESWAKQWERAQADVEHWIKMAKLEEKDPEEAARLRELSGTSPDAPAKPKPSEDELDVD